MLKQLVITINFCDTSFSGMAVLHFCTFRHALKVYLSRVSLKLLTFLIIAKKVIFVYSWTTAQIYLLFVKFIYHFKFRGLCTWRFGHFIFIIIIMSIFVCISLPCAHHEFARCSLAIWLCMMIIIWWDTVKSYKKKSSNNERIFFKMFGSRSIRGGDNAARKWPKDGSKTHEEEGKSDRKRRSWRKLSQ